MGTKQTLRGAQPVSASAIPMHLEISAEIPRAFIGGRSPRASKAFGGANEKSFPAGFEPVFELHWSANTYLIQQFFFLRLSNRRAGLLGMAP